MLSDYKTDREEKVLELYNNEGKTTRDIAKDVRMSRNINIILKKHVVNHGIAIVGNKKSSNEKATQAYKLFSGTRTLLIANRCRKYIV